ncbi:aminopeptidase N [Actinomadura sp. KC216]|uniref:aminopeptidase N n=1 Tax=Actinomadura sp. KC216 TaxID=2530370 RepID=UPI00104C172C|nr:aminopeptidase N [Actinomadura sp. KC216]TDB91386.1 aminopeptidase N [Actinomadura sp. KC216]
MASRLTKDEAFRRAALLRVREYEIELDLTGAETFRSTTTVRFECADPSADTFADLHGAAVSAARLNGRLLDGGDYDSRTGRLSLSGLRAANELTVVAELPYSRTGEGLHRFVDPPDGRVYLHSQFECAEASRVYACFDQPDLKARFTFTVTAPPDWTVVSCTQPVRETGGIWRFPATEPLPTYLTAIVAGHYESVTADYGDGRVPMALYYRASRAADVEPEEIFDVTRQGLRFYEEVFGRPYPFGKYDQLFVPEANAGAMENAGCVTLKEDFLFRSRVTEAARERRAVTILHELAHMWFGDLVTMRWWDDLWLKESFATYMSVLCQAEATRWQGAWTTFASATKEIAYRQDQLPSTHPIVTSMPDIHSVEANFDGITYYKGASVLKQLVAYVGSDNFLRGVRDYFRRYAWGTATLPDLLACLEETSRRDLATWSREWLETAGVNTLRPEPVVDSGGRLESLTVVQEAASEAAVLRSHRMAVGLYDLTPAGLVRRRRVEIDVVGARTEVPALAGEPRPDLLLLNDDDLTYAKVRYDAASLATLAAHIGEFRADLPLAVCWAALWDMCRDAELPARTYARLVIDGIAAGAVDDVGVVQSLLRQAREALVRFADPAHRDAALEHMAGALLERARTVAAGSELQLCLFQSFLRTATSAGQLATIRALLDGERSVPGLDLDVDLRWTALRRLVVRGEAGQAEIARQLDRDPSASGNLLALGCSAAVPTPDAKDSAWRRICGGDLSNAEFRALLEGFSEPEHAKLLRPYRDAFFEVVGAIWQDWSVDMAHHFARDAYPGHAVEPETVARTETYLKDGSIPAALRRLLLEGLDEVARALRGRDLDAGARQATSHPVT